MIPPQTIISAPVHTAVCRSRGDGTPQAWVGVQGSAVAHDPKLAGTTGGTTAPSRGGTSGAKLEDAAAHQASNGSFAHDAVATVTPACDASRIATTRNASSSSMRALTRPTGREVRAAGAVSVIASPTRPNAVWRRRASEANSSGASDSPEASSVSGPARWYERRRYACPTRARSSGVAIDASVDSAAARVAA